MKRCDCVRCKNFAPCESATGFCDRFEPTYQTNADRIRSMSDEELAEAIAAIGLDKLEKIPFCNSNDLCTDILDDGKLIPESLCKQCLINWLQSEVEE